MSYGKHTNEKTNVEVNVRIIRMDNLKDTGLENRLAAYIADGFDIVEAAPGYIIMIREFYKAPRESEPEDDV